MFSSFSLVRRSALSSRNFHFLYSSSRYINSCRCLYANNPVSPTGSAAIAATVDSVSSAPKEVQASAKAAVLKSAVAPSSVKLTPQHVMAAYKRISSVVQRTPLDFSPKLSKLAGCQLYFKKEHLSITGSYKERGALNKMLQLTEDEKKRGVICSSAGNHAQAVSYHSTRLGIDGVIVMPVNTPFVKVDATRNFGAKVVLAGESFAEAYEHALKIAKAENRTFIHAFNDAEIVAGQGTVAMELLEQNPYMDAVVVPIGGGGLIAGMALLLKHINPRIKIYGVETAAMPGMYTSVKSGHVQPVPKRASMADGIAIENVGQVPFEIIKDKVDDIVLVDEDEIASSVLMLLEKEKTVVEGSGAAALAAVLHDKIPAIKDKDQNVVVLCTGGNIDMTLLGRIIDKGLVKSGRLARIRVSVLDIPGQLAKVCNILNEERVNVKEIVHERAFLVANVGMTQPILTIETKGFDHVHAVIARLKKEGFINTSLDTPNS